MRASLITLAVFGAGAIARPSLQRLHLHSKRDSTPQLVHSWDSDGVHHEEFVVHKTVIVNGAPPAAVAPAASPKKAEVVSVAPVAPSPSPVPAPAPVAPKVAEKKKVATPVVIQEQEPATPETPSTGSCSNQIGGDASAWASSPCSGGKSIIDSLNQMRSNWESDLGSRPLTWDADLAANARSTALGSEQGAKAEIHTLNSGSMAQVIAPGDGTTSSDNLTPFELAAKMWLCEIPKGNIGCTSPTNGGDTGHADIISSSAYTKTGCYYMNASGPGGVATGLWTCDFA